MSLFIIQRIPGYTHKPDKTMLAYGIKLYQMVFRMTQTVNRYQLIFNLV